MRKLFVFSLIFTILFTQVAYALPAPGTPGNADYVEPDSDYIESDMDYIDPDLDSEPFSSIKTITNTVDYSKVILVMQYYDASGTVRYKEAPFDSRGHASLGRPADFYENPNYWVALKKGSLPPSGTYRMQFDWSSDVGIDWSHIALESYKSINNATSQYSIKNIPFQKNSGDIYFDTVIDMGTVNVVQVWFRKDSVPSPPFGGYVKINFTKTTSSNPDFSTPGVGSASEDIQQGIQDNTSQVANNTGELVDGQREIMDTLKDIVQTISYQLEAFWLQLAHEFTNLYNKMNEQHAELIKAIQDGFNVTIINKFQDLIENNNENTDKVIDNNNQNHQEQIDNDNKNTDTIVNGYDNSGLNQSNQNLSDALNKYQEEEDKLLADTKDKIEDFEFQNPFDTFVAPLEDVAYFLNGIYMTLGSFNIPIGFSLTLTIALLCIGWYRFRGGG